jgi:hypothetical protein
MEKIAATRTRGSPQETDLGFSFRHSFIPLLALFAGGLAGKVLAGVSGFTGPVKTALGPMLGSFVTTENLILFFGLCSLLLSTRRLWRTGRKRQLPGANRPGAD